MSVRLEEDDHDPHVAHLYLDFGRLNLLTPTAIDELRATLAEVSDRTAVLTVQGVGDDSSEIAGLSAGLHLEEVREYDEQSARELLNGLYEAIRTLRNERAVTVCNCGAYALGAGLELAMACDFRIATKKAILGLPEINVGLVTGIQGGLLIRLVGLQQAKELIFTGDPVSGTHGAEIGLINRAVDAENIEEVVSECTNELATKPPEILQRQSDVFQAWRSVGTDAGIRGSRETIALCFGTNAQRESMAAFLDQE